jgi:hypothetical protein
LVAHQENGRWTVDALGCSAACSSPHARRGVLWDVFRRHYGAGGDPLILVAHGTSRSLNPSLPQRVVDRALEKDRARATAEYLAQFRTDVEGFVGHQPLW